MVKKEIIWFCFSCTWSDSLTGRSVEADPEGVGQSFLEFLDPGVNLVVQDDQDHERTDDVEEQVHPQNVNLEFNFIQKLNF